MTSDEYQKQCLRTDLTPIGYSLAGDRAKLSVDLLHGCLGLMSELGEIADTLKKHIFYGQALDSDNLFEEAGDVDWYLSILADKLLAARSNIQQANIEKLRIRYPEKFTEEHAKMRLDKVTDSRVVCVACGADGHRVENCPHVTQYNISSV